MDKESTFKYIFGNETTIEKVRFIFPTIDKVIDSVLKENDNITSLVNLQVLMDGAKEHANIQFIDYHNRNPNDQEAFNMNLAYKFWIDEKNNEYKHKIEKEMNSKEDKDITHLEVLLALEILVKKATGKKNLMATKLVRLLYYLKRETPTSKIENTTEYDQFTTLKSKIRTKDGKDVLKNNSQKAAEFLNSIGLNEIGDQLITNSKK